MIYALVRGWLAGMAAVLVEILLAAIFLVQGISPRTLTENFSPTLSSIILVAFLEESMKLAALRGISDETTPFFRNAIFKGLLVGLGFAFFEASLKILFQGEDLSYSVSLGAISGGVLHIVTGGVLGFAWFFRTRGRTPTLFLFLFFVAIVLHIFYNTFLSPVLFERFS